MIQIVKMRETHVAAVAALEKACFSLPWDENSVRSELSNALSLWLIAEEDGEVLGYVGSQTVLGESDMLNLAVREDQRRKGIGNALVVALCEALRAENSISLTLEVRASNEAAKALYDAMGFETVGKRPRYYSRPVEDALILRKELNR